MPSQEERLEMLNDIYKEIEEIISMSWHTKQDIEKLINLLKKSITYQDISFIPKTIQTVSKLQLIKKSPFRLKYIANDIINVISISVCHLYYQNYSLEILSY
jgi:hypothetical protein